MLVDEHDVGVGLPELECRAEPAEGSADTAGAVCARSKKIDVREIPGARDLGVGFGGAHAFVLRGELGIELFRAGLVRNHPVERVDERDRRVFAENERRAQRRERDVYVTDARRKLLFAAERVQSPARDVGSR